jgi:putative endonuclease
VQQKDAVGRRGEDRAVAYLQAQGYEVLARNWRSPAGELDVVARDGSTVVVVEVKTRSGRAFGHPLEAITPIKLARLRRLARDWLTDAGLGPVALRIDAVAVVESAHGTEIEHLTGVF